MPNYNKKIEIKFDIVHDNYHLQISLIDKIIYILYHNILIYQFINFFKFLIKYLINEIRLITTY